MPGVWVSLQRFGSRSSRYGARRRTGSRDASRESGRGAGITFDLAWEICEGQPEVLFGHLTRPPSEVVELVVAEWDRIDPWWDSR